MQENTEIGFGEKDLGKRQVIWRWHISLKVYGEWGKATYLEPLTASYKQFGPGRASQVITFSKINSVFSTDKLRWKMKDVRDEIIEELKGKVQEELLDEIEILINDGKYRQAFYKLDQIKKLSDFKVSTKYIALLEKFWWDYAN